MTNEAQKHLDKALKLLAKGDDFYAQAADEIIAARAGGATWPECGDALDRSVSWCKKIAQWRELPANERSSSTPYAGMADEINARKTKQLLREAPMEQVEQMISELPKERQQAIAAAAGSGYDRARFEEGERVKNLTPAERKEIEAAKAGIAGPIDKALGGFATLGVVGHIEQATEDLSQMIADNAITAESIYRIEQAHALFVTELEVAKAMAGLGEESFA